MNQILFLDIETARDSSIPDELYNAAILKNENQYMFLPAYNKIIALCIGWINKEWVFSVKSLEWDEREMLEKFFSFIDRYVIIGYNVLQFDLPFIIHRAMHYGLRIPDCLRTFWKKPWEINNVIDLMQVSKSFGLRYYSLNDMCLLLGIASPKDGMDGSQIQQAYDDGKLDDIVHYCMADIVATKNLFDKFVTLNLLPPTS